MAEVTFAVFLRDHYTPYAFSIKRSASWEQIIFRVHLIPAFGDMPLHTIGRASITALVIAKQKAGYKPGTINRILANLRVVLSKALEWKIGGLEINAAKQVKGLRDPPHLDRYLSQIEAQRLMRSLEAGSSAMLRFIVPFLLFTGARKREALDAQWRFVDLERATWTIPLTKSGRPRHIPLSPQALSILEQAKREAQASGLERCDWIFPNVKTGKPYVTIFHAWDRCRREAGLGDVRIHDLRHSFVSAFVNRGMTLYDVKELLGHANVTTWQRYAHLSPQRLQNAVAQAGVHYEIESSAHLRR
jgi:integrase